MSRALRCSRLILALVTVVATVAAGFGPCGLESGFGGATDEGAVVSESALLQQGQAMDSHPGGPCEESPAGRAPHGNPCLYLSACSLPFIAVATWQTSAPGLRHVAVTCPRTLAPRSITSVPDTPPPKA